MNITEKKKEMNNKSITTQNKTKFNIISNIIISFLIFIIIALGSFLRVEVAKNKEYFHMDEIYSQGLINYTSVQLSENKDLNNTVHNKEFFKDYIEISEEEASDFKPVIQRQLEDVHPPLYYFFLKIFTNFNLNNFSMWPGIILNILVYAISTILIFLISFKLSKNKILSLLSIILYTIASMAVDHAIFIRMYEMSNMFILLHAYILISILVDKQRIKEETPDKKANNEVKSIKKDNYRVKNLFKDLERYKKTMYPILALVTILGALTHYYFLVYVFMTYILSIIYLLKTQRKNEAIIITLTYVLSGIFYLIIWPFKLDSIFAKINKENINIIDKITKFIKKINYGYINIVLSIILLSIIKVINIITNKLFKKIKPLENKEIEHEIKLKTEEIKNIKRVSLILFLSTMFYVLVPLITAPFVANRYTYPALPLLSILIIVLIYFNLIELIKNLFNLKKIKKENTFKFLPIILIIFIGLVLVFPQSVNLKQALEEGLEYQYKDKVGVIEKIEELKNIPLIYVYDNKQFFDITDDIYPLSKIEKSIIVPRKKINNEEISLNEYMKDIKENIDKIYNSKNNTELLVLTHYWYNEEELCKFIAKDDFNKESINFELEESEDIKIYPTHVKLLKEISKYTDLRNIKYITHLNSTYLFLLSK